MNRTILLSSIFVLGLGIIVGIVFLTWNNKNAASSTTAYSAPGLPPMTAKVAGDAFYKLAPALLLQVYDAFGQTKEDEIYDTLSGVTSGDALEYLYLERVGAMAGGGLEEADQEIHEINLLNSELQRDGTILSIDAVWQVIGTVGHAEHLHVRGNTYSADLTVSPVDGAWKITSFKLLDVNRDAAGETFVVNETD